MSLTILDLSSPHVSRPKNLDHRAQDVPTRLRNAWARQGIKLRPGLSPLELEQVESKLKICFPKDLRECFFLADGFDGEMDNECIAFLSMQDALEETNGWSIPDSEATHMFAFADFLISSHVYMIDLLTKHDGSNPVYVVYDTKPDAVRKVSNNFSDFVNGYVEVDYSILFPK